MRNPARKALYCFIAFVAAAALAWFGAVREQRIGEHWTAIAPLLLGLAVAPLALLALVRALFAARGQARLQAGRGVIARWRVEAGEWESFRALDFRRAAERPELVNFLGMRRTVPPGGVEVIVGEESLLVERSYHRLPRGGLERVGWLAGPPACLEFTFAVPSGAEGNVLPPTLRLPVPAQARGAGQRVVDHFAGAGRLGRRTEGR